MPEISDYASAYHSMTWEGPRGYPQDANAGRCYITGMLGMLRYHGEPDVLFADGTSGDGFSFRWAPAWGAPAFNGGTGPFHEIWEYTPAALGFRGRWEEDAEGGWDEAWERLRHLIDRGLPVQVGTHYSVMLPHGARTSPRLAHLLNVLPPGPGFGHHVVVAGYDLARDVVLIYEPNDILPHARYECPIPLFRRAWEEAAQREGGHYSAWPNHRGWDGEWSLHDGYGPYQMMWVEPGRDPAWDVATSIRDSFRRNLKILRGEYPKPYATFANQWMIPHLETGAPGMARCAEAVRAGTLRDALQPDGSTRRLFSQIQIPNHGVLGRAGAAGYLERVARELSSRGLDGGLVAGAAARMRESSTLFRTLRYEDTLPAAGDLLGRIADVELDALDFMERAWPEVRALGAGASPPVRRSSRA